MLALDDPRWHELWTDYSMPQKFLPALHRLLDDPACHESVVGEFSVENYVCHQYSVYHTTLAVVPHFVHAAGRLPVQDRNRLLDSAGLHTLLLRQSLESPEWPKPPEWLVTDFEAAVRTAIPLACDTLAAPAVGDSSERGKQLGNDPEFRRLWLMASLAAFHDERRVAWLLFQIAFSQTCPYCEAEFEPLKIWGREP